MINLNKIFLSIAIYFFIFSQAHAFCNFETIKIGDQISSLNFQLNNSLDTPSNDGLYEMKVLGKEICIGPAYENVNLIFHFINNRLQKISAYDVDNKINHLDGLINFYGKPTNSKTNSKLTGISFYSWDLGRIDVFLSESSNTNGMISNIEIIGNEYSIAMSEHVDNDE